MMLRVNRRYGGGAWHAAVFQFCVGLSQRHFPFTRPHDDRLNSPIIFCKHRSAKISPLLCPRNPSAVSGIVIPAWVHAVKGQSRLPRAYHIVVKCLEGGLPRLVNHNTFGPVKRIAGVLRIITSRFHRLPLWVNRVFVASRFAVCAQGFGVAIITPTTARFGLTGYQSILADNLDGTAIAHATPHPHNLTNRLSVTWFLRNYRESGEFASDEINSLFWHTISIAT